MFSQNLCCVMEALVQPMSEVKGLYAAILSTYKNDYSGAQDPAVVYSLNILLALPEKAVVAALKQYYLFAPSPFYDWAAIMRLVKSEILKDMGHKLPDDAYAILTTLVRWRGAHNPPTLPEKVQAALDLLGGWGSFCGDYLKLEPNFKRAYGNILDKIAEEKILEYVN